ncbi:MAG: hypothetical protein COA97_09130 [Flavobacteriales bacterium]|nr:MAG: hypothetical protein COA97_09130 [Flavobacteriales bacterium]
MDLDYLKIFTAIVLAVLGWLAGHYLTSQRDKKNKSREISVKHLIDAYLILTTEIVQRPDSESKNRKIENVISEIQLFGSKKQVELAKILADEVSEGKNFQLDFLINSLRDDLRKQINLKSIEGNVRWLRYHD